MRFLFNHDMKPLGTLFIQRQNMYRELLQGIKEEDVREDRNFEATISRIKDTVLLEPVKIEEPRIVDHHGSGGFCVFLHFPFWGNEELFSHFPDNDSTEDIPKLLPEGNYIPVEVELSVLDKAMAISQAKEQLKHTRIFIEANNKQVIEWRNKLDATIDFDLNRLRKEILALYS